MRIKFLGTGAAEAYPALYCNCKNCQRARTLGGRNLRARSSALVNNDLLIDYGPDTSAQCVRFNVDLTKVRNILITHSHGDHLHMRDLIHRKKSSRNYGTLDMTIVWGNHASINIFNEQIGNMMIGEFSQGHIKIVPTINEVIEDAEDFLLVKTKVIQPHQSITIGKYQVHTIDANHNNEREDSMNFIIDDGKTRLLYGNDTGLWAESEWNFIESLGITMDVVALDCTVGLNAPGGHHSNETFLKTRNEFITRNLLSKDSIFYAHHFSHQNNFVYDDIVEIMKQHNVEVTHDGLIVER